MAVPKAEIYGNAVADGKEGMTQKGERYIFVRVATSDSRKDEATQQWETLRELFVQVKMFRVDANTPVPMKGDKVAAYGKLSEEHYTTQEGVERMSVAMDADFIRVIPKNGGGFGGAQPGPAAQGLQQQQFNGGMPQQGMSPAQYAQNAAQQHAQQQMPQGMGGMPQQGMPQQYGQMPTGDTPPFN